MFFLRRCYNCGEFANHIAAKCTMGPQPKRCHSCKSEDHLIADCPARPERRSDDPKPDTSPEHNGNGTEDDAAAAATTSQTPSSPPPPPPE